MPLDGEDERPLAWVLSTGKTGHDVKCIGVAQALGARVEIRRVPGFPMSHLGPRLPIAIPPLDGPPWPDLVMGSGRKIARFVRAIRRRSGGRSFAAFFDNPGYPASDYDLVWVSSHDTYPDAPNVLRTLTAPHRLAAADLDEGRAALLARLGAQADAPLRVGVLLGGKSNSFSFGADTAAALGRQLRLLQDERGALLLVTASRRTEAASLAAFNAEIDTARAFIYAGPPEPNPYAGILGLGDHFVVTCDSANMIGEAAMTGRPIHAVRLPGGAAKFEVFFERMVEAGAMRWFDGTLDDWSYTPIDATPVVADAIRARLPADLLARLSRWAPPARP